MLIFYRLVARILCLILVILPGVGHAKKGHDDGQAEADTRSDAEGPTPRDVTDRETSRDPDDGEVSWREDGDEEAHGDPPFFRSLER